MYLQLLKFIIGGFQGFIRSDELFQFFKELYTDPEIPVLIRISATALTIGAVILLVSFIRERIFAYNRDRYKEVTR